MYTVALQECIDKMNLECLTPEVELEDIKITQSDINRPALQLAGFFDYFDHHRVQIIGHVENTYMENQGMDYSTEMMGNPQRPTKRTWALGTVMRFWLTSS